MWYLVVILVLNSASLSFCEDNNRGYLTVNGVRHKTYNPKSKDDSCDAYGQYEFIDGQAAAIACLSTSKENYHLQMSYTKMNKKEIWNRTEVMPPTNHSTLYIKLSQDFDNGYIECTLSDVNSKSKSLVIRLLLRLKQTPIDLGFQVNGLILPVHVEEDKKIFEYEYFLGEKLTIQSLKDETQYGTMSCSGTENLLPKELKTFIDWEGENINCITTLGNKYQVTSLNCTIKNKSNLLSDYFSLKLIRVTNAIRDYPVIEGLSMANVSLKFNGTKHNTIHYEYKEDELLRLTCFVINEGAKWDYSVSEVENETDAGKAAETAIKGEFKLKPNARSSVISCSTTMENEPRELTITKVTLIREVESDFFHPSHVSTNIPIWLASCSALLLIGVVVRTIIKLTKRRRLKPKTDSTGMPYENLPDHNKGPMSVPKQWDEAMYAKPVDAATENTEYAAPYNPETVEELYSKPIPKHLRQKPLPKESAYATVGDAAPTYAQVTPKSLRDPNKPIPPLKPVFKTGNRSGRSNINMPSDESPYAEIPTTSHYAELSLKQRPNAEASYTESPYAEVTSYYNN